MLGSSVLRKTSLCVVGCSKGGESRQNADVGNRSNAEKGSTGTKRSDSLLDHINASATSEKAFFSQEKGRWRIGLFGEVKDQVTLKTSEA